jgi:hypothetical protein
MSKSELSETIAHAFGGWLNAEVRSSGTEVNTYLDDYSAAIRGLEGGREHKDNFYAIKHNSHVGNRIPQDLQRFEVSLEPDFPIEKIDYHSAALMFTPLMQVSGNRRVQCYIEAKDAEDYLVKRHSVPAGIDLEQVAYNRLDKWLPRSENFTNAFITPEKLSQRIGVVSRIGGRAVSEICQRAERAFDIGLEDSALAQVLKTGQIEWAGLATDCVILAAKLRKGELAAVPFWEPKSISANPPPEVIYPFSAEFNGF